MKIYEVYFDHQIEGRKIGTFSSLDKAKSFLVKNENCDLKTEKTYPGKWFYKTSSGLNYFIEEISVS